MKKKYLIVLMGILCCLYSFSLEKNNPPEPIQFERVTVTSTCISTPDNLFYLYSYEIDLCGINSPNGNPSSFHAYIRPSSSDSWRYMGEPNLIDSNNLIFEDINNYYDAPLSEETWIIRGYYNYIDPTNINDSSPAFNFCSTHLSFDMPALNYSNCDVCDIASNVSVFDASVKMCDASFIINASYNPTLVTLIPGTVTLDYGDNTPILVGNFEPGPNPTGYFGWYTDHTYTANGTYTVTFSFNTQSISTGNICTTTETIDVTIKDCAEECIDQPYIEPHWALCETNNICKLDSWPIRVLDDDGSPLLLIDGYTFSWMVDGTEVSNSDIFYGAQEDVTYTVTVTYPNGCEYTTTYTENCCEAKDVVITADDVDISDTLTYTMPCGDTCIDLNATNLTSVVYNTNDPVLGNSNGLFCLGTVEVDDFTVTITGKDTCGDPYSVNVTILVEQDCCIDDISVIFDECPNEKLKHLSEYNPNTRTLQTPINYSSKEDCDPCDAGVIAITIADINGNEITNYETINISWDANPNGIDVTESQFLVNVDVLYTATVTLVDGCEYTYDFIYDCKTVDCKAIEAPTNLQTNGSSLSWDPVPGAVSYIISSPGTININCCNSSGLSIAPMQTTNSSLELSKSLQGKCFVWQVIAICVDGSESAISEQACHLPTSSKLASKDIVSIYPNPNNGYMNIKLELEDDSNIALKIYRFDGVLVKTIENLKTFQGKLKTNLNVNLTSGLYFFKFEYQDKTITKRVIIK